MHTSKNKNNPIRIEPANLLRPNDSMDLNQPEKTSFSPSNKGTLNLRLMGKALNQLDTGSISGTQKVRLNVAKLSIVKEKFLTMMHS